MKLDGAFDRAEPTPYSPACNYCPPPQNPYNTGAQPEDFTPTYLFQYPKSATLGDTFWGMEEVVPIHALPDEAWNGDAGPISEYFGRQVVLVRPQQ